MLCPRCNASGTRVVDSREGADGKSVRRRRECEECAFRYTTFERIEDWMPMVIKKGGHRESFDRQKILAGLKKACEKRPVSVQAMEDTVRAIETKILDSGEKEISSEAVGEFVINQLRELDQVAYVRFASVYREFSDVEQFLDTLRHLVGSPEAIAAGSKKKVISISSKRPEEKTIQQSLLFKNDSRKKSEEETTLPPPEKLGR